MNIEQIRAEIPEAFTDFNGVFAWIVSHGMSEYSSEHSHLYDIQTAARMLVDQAFEAGKADAIVIPDNATIAKISNESFDCGFEAGYNNAAKDPKAWYVLDKNGEQVHIKDKTTLPNGTTKTIKALGDGGGCSTNTTWIDLGKCEKFTPDSWEKFAEDLSNQLVNAALGRLSEEEKSPDEIAETFVERAREMIGGPGC